MQAKKYELKVFEGTMDWIHGGGQTIIEYYIPELNLCINEKSAFLVTEEEDRVPEGYFCDVIELDPDTADSLKALAPLLDVRDKLEKRIRESLGILKDE